MSGWMAAACLLGLAAVGAEALRLSAYGLARYLNSDFLTPYFFCSEIVTGRYPLSGWTLSSAPSFVPDHAVLTGLFGAFGPSSLSYTLYTLIFYPALFILAGLCVGTAIGRTTAGLLAGLLFGSGLLALQALPGWHAMWLWWLGAPCCHGGLLLVGMAYLWALGAGLRRGSVGSLPVALFTLGLAGMWSDTLFLFQILLPASFSLFVCQRRQPGCARWLRWQGGCAVAALVCAQAFKPICLFFGWFYFSRLLRISPTPAHQWHALKQFLSDLPALLFHGWGFALLALAAAAWGWRAMQAWKQPGFSPETPANGVHHGLLDFYRVFCLTSLLLMLPLPVVVCSWRDADRIRYLFNWLFLPGFLLTLEGAAGWFCTVGTSFGERRGWHRLLAGSAVVFLLCFGCAVGGLRSESTSFPYPDDVAALDAVLQRHHLKYGLAEYWNSKYVTALSHAGAELRQIRANGEPYFWDNNAFGYYERNTTGALSWPSYQYILADQLDERAVANVFGLPATKEAAGRFEVWIYAADGQQRIRNVLEPAVQAKLGPKRLPLLLGIVAPNADGKGPAR